MFNALIYSPRFDGHRQVYVLVIADILRKVGYNIIIAGNLNQQLNDCSYIDTVKKMDGVKLINTNKYKNGGYDISIEEFIKLQEEFKVDLTVFAEADFHISLFSSQVLTKKYKFRGRTVGIFLRPFYYYKRGGLTGKMRFLKNFQSRWRSDQRLFYEFIMKHFSVLDVPLTIDENFASMHKYFVWLPDVFQKYADSVVPEHNEVQRKWIEKLNSFMNKNIGKFPFFYFGTAQFRRGYDILLNMALKEDGCFIHCGLRDDREKFDYDVNKIRLVLEKNGRLFETNEYIVDPICIEHFFKSVTHLVLPYREYFGSSGVMLQALDYEIPVLSPEYGIIGHRIKNYKLGMTYNEMNGGGLKTQFDLFRTIDPKTFEKDIKSYMNFQTKDQLRNTLINSFTGAELPVKIPSFIDHDRAY
jgi:hypothetical protein